jgi:hypothetical protein
VQAETPKMRTNTVDTTFIQLDIGAPNLCSNMKNVIIGFADNQLSYQFPISSIIFRIKSGAFTLR